MKCPSVLALAFVIGAVLASKAAVAEVKVREISIGTVTDSDAIKAISFSDDSQHLAYLIALRATGNLSFSMGKTSAPYDLGGSRQPVGYAPHGRHLGFITQTGDEMAVLMDGTVVGKGYFSVASNHIYYSEDGAHFAYAAQPVKDGALLVVRDGVAGVQWPGLFAAPTFSPDGLQLAYGAVNADKKSLLVLDEKLLTAYDAIPPATILFSPDSKRLAYTAICAPANISACSTARSFRRRMRCG